MTSAKPVADLQRVDGADHDAFELDLVAFHHGAADTKRAVTRFAVAATPHPLRLAAASEVRRLPLSA